MYPIWPWPIIFNILFKRKVIIPVPIYIFSTYAHIWLHIQVSLTFQKFMLYHFALTKHISPWFLVTERNPKRISGFTKKGKK